MLRGRGCIGIEDAQTLIVERREGVAGVENAVHVGLG